MTFALLHVGRQGAAIGALQHTMPSGVHIGHSVGRCQSGSKFTVQPVIQLDHPGGVAEMASHKGLLAFQPEV